MPRLRLTLILTLALGLAPLAAQPPTLADDLAGVYRCDGINGFGDRYRGVVIIARHQDSYRVQWRFPGGPEAAGLGIRHGDVLAVSYFGLRPGVVLYEIAGNRLLGRWTVLGAGGVLARETLTPLHALPAPDPAHRPPAGRAVDGRTIIRV
jgi:hypothetical protein